MKVPCRIVGLGALILGCADAADSQPPAAGLCPSCESLASLTPPALNLIVDGDQVYVQQTTGEISRIPKAGGDLWQLARGATLANQRLAIGGGYAVWVEQDPIDERFFRLSWVATHGGPATSVALLPGSPRLALSSTGALVPRDNQETLLTELVEYPFDGAANRVWDAGGRSDEGGPLLSVAYGAGTAAWCRPRTPHGVRMYRLTSGGPLRDGAVATGCGMLTVGIGRLLTVGTAANGGSDVFEVHDDFSTSQLFHIAGSVDQMVDLDGQSLIYATKVAGSVVLRGADGSERELLSSTSSQFSALAADSTRIFAAGAGKLIWLPWP